jgi:hypothetical protein
MFFGYPIEATAENWFHECLVEIIHTIHNCVRNSQEPPNWPEIIPIDYRDTLRRKTGLRNRLEDYKVIIRSFNNDELDHVENALINQNDISRLLSGENNCEAIEDLPEALWQPVKCLFEFSFELLTDLEIRDHQYREIFDRVPYHVCPFCGCEYFDAPGAPREALDHYLAESKYPFAATNLRNLVPMGNKCNSKYKLAQDILYRDDGTRRRSQNPYGKQCGVHVSLDRSEPFAGLQKTIQLPNWQIDFSPEVEEVSTWNTVFHIEERFRRDILDTEFTSWLTEFSKWCRESNFQIINVEDLINVLDHYIAYMERIGMRDRAFLKAAVFQMLRHQCQKGNIRLINVLQGVVIGGMT